MPVPKSNKALRKVARRFALIMVLPLLFGMPCALAGGPEFDAARLAERIHALINHARQERGLPALRWDVKLAQIAQRHSEDMARQQYFSHTNADGADPSERAARQGWHERKALGGGVWAEGVAENIYLNHLYDRVVTTYQGNAVVGKRYDWNSEAQIASTTVAGWMDSPGHRENILGTEYDRQGLGVAVNGNDVYITEDMF